MYFPIGWPRTLDISESTKVSKFNDISCDAVKLLVAVVGDDFLGIWYANPLVPITFFYRTLNSVSTYGRNYLIHWKPDSRKLAIITTNGVLLLYEVIFDANSSGVFAQIDSPLENLKRDSAELFVKDNIPSLHINEMGIVCFKSIVTSLCCISLTDIILTTNDCEIIKTSWEEIENKDAHMTINLRKIPFYLNQNSHLKSLPSIAANAFIIAIEYSPFIGGFAAVFNDNRAAFLIGPQLKLKDQKLHGFWLPDIDDATTCSVNHKFRLLAFGRKNSEVAVYTIEDTTGGPEFSHKLSLNSKVFPGILGSVNEVKWTPDGCAVIISWDNGGISLWSTFGTMLMSSLTWDFGVHVDLSRSNPLTISRMEWSTEGYQLFLIRKTSKTILPVESNLLMLSFVKSTLSMNPCMASNPHILLQGDDTLYINQGDSLEKIYSGSKFTFPNNRIETDSKKLRQNENFEINKTVDISSILSQSKYWSVLQLPYTYISTNWPIRYSAIDYSGFYVAVAGRTGLAHYSLLKRKWKLFGNESQEKDFVVSGGLLWWEGFIILGCYSLLDRTDEIRCYPQECKLDNLFGNKIHVRAPVISINVYKNQLVVLTADGTVNMFILKKNGADTINVDCISEIDIKSICIHPACIVSLSVTNLKNEPVGKSVNLTESSPETIIFNVCGRILTMHLDLKTNVINPLMATCLASCVECFWLSTTTSKSPMRDCLWLYSGSYGMRVWLPIHPPNEEVHETHRLHSFMSKRIMLSFPLKLYPLVILLDNVIVLGVENETTLYTNEGKSVFALPYSFLERKTQVYLHKILRQLIKRNLGYSAWEIAKSYCALPYFPHSLELLLHEVLEEEATSKDPIPDALLPSILDFIREFPVYMQTIVQCARKTEIALWPYLFSVAGKPKDLFQHCLQKEELETAASYLIIIQNLEPSAVSKEYATLLLDICLDNRKWDLAKDLIRFLKAIDPNEIDSPRSSMIVNNKIAPPTQSQAQVNSNPEVFNLILGPIARERSFSTSVPSNLTKSAITIRDKKEKAQSSSILGSNYNNNTISKENIGNSSIPIVCRKTHRSNLSKERIEPFLIETILQRHARKLLQNCKLIDLGHMSAFLDFHLVSWLTQEKDKSAKLNDFVNSLLIIHKELNLPSPFPDINTKLKTNAVNYTSVPKMFSVQDHWNSLVKPSSYTSESGYFSVSSGEVLHLSNSRPYSDALVDNKEMHYGPVPSNDEEKLCSRSSNRFYSMFDITKNTRSDNYNFSSDCRENPLPEKLEVKLRYLLQFFIEADCIDFALILSILLFDAASIGRIIDGVIRSESITSCNRIETALKKITQWSFENDCIYRVFIINLQPHIYLLEKYAQLATKTNTSSSANTTDRFAEISSESSSSTVCRGNMQLHTIHDDFNGKTKTAISEHEHEQTVENNDSQKYYTKIAEKSENGYCRLM